MIVKNKIVVLTGAAGGIGSVIARKFVSEGATLVLLDVEQKPLDELQIALQSNDVYAYLTDIANEKQVQNVIQKISSTFGRIDVLINNAGIQSPIGCFIKNDLAFWRRNIEVNLFGAVHCSYYALQSMKRQGKGKIINLSGGGSTSPRPVFSAYSAAKTAIVRFSETLAEELRENHIDVNAIAPGAVNTKMLDELLDIGIEAGKEFKDALLRKEKGGNDPKVVADLICFLASDAADGITGKLISAPWDPWQKVEFQNILRTDKDIATLRRIDNKIFFKKN